MSTVVGIVLIIIALAVGLAGGFFVNATINKRGAKTAQDYMNKAIEGAKESIAKAQIDSKDILLGAKEEAASYRESFNKEQMEARAEIKIEKEQLREDKKLQKQKDEQLIAKERTLDKKLLDVDDIRAQLAKQQQELKDKELELETTHGKILETIELCAKMSKEEAKAKLIESIETEAKRDAIKFIREADLAAKEEADNKAKEIVALAIQRCGVDHCAEVTVSTVALPSDEIKGRIIGREGRNIRAIENAVGIELIIDDTPNVIVLSGFDPVRREIAKLTLEKLISDGRIHPTRIEELVEKIRKDVEAEIKKSGEAAMYEANVLGLHPDIVKLMGRLKFRTSYGQNILKHSIESAHIAGIIANELGADVKLARRGAFLHDLGKAADHEVEGTHVSIGVDIAKKYKESNAVINCIAAHHNDVEPTSIESIIVQVADAISGARPGARRDSVGDYVKRLSKLEDIANTFGGVEKSFALQAGREIRVIVKPEAVSDVEAVYLAKDIAKQIEGEMDYPGQIKVNVIREVRSVEYAK